jgi:hypothetical protein
MSSFNDIMRQFLSDLASVFPEDIAIQTSLESFEDIVRINFKKPAQMFTETIGPHLVKIMHHDETVFDEINMPGVDFNKLWKSDISDNTKNAIFCYLKQLLILSASK